MKIILALYPSYRVLGYACIETPQKLKDFGVIRVRPFSVRRMLKRIEKFFEFHQPEIVLLRDPENPIAMSPRIQKFFEAIKTLSGEYKLPVYHYTREQIKGVFENFGAKTKHEIAYKIIEWFPDMASRAPQLRETWRPEWHGMEVFDSLALCVTHAFLT